MNILTILILLLGEVSLAESKVELNQKLDQVRVQKLEMEKALIEAEKSKKTTEEQLARLKRLQRLQNQEKALTLQRLATLDKYLNELQTRKAEMKKKRDAAFLELRQRFSKIIHPLLQNRDRLIRGEEGEAKFRFREKVISSLAYSELKDLEALSADLLDAEEIESRIEQEKQQISALMQDVSEQESLILFHKKIREDLSKDRNLERLQQLEEYQKLKVSESEIERMITDFGERQKLVEEKDQKKKSPLIVFKPKSLPWPLQGRIVGAYGQYKDPKSGLNIFRKGIEILTNVDQAPIKSVMDGRIQFSGEVPGKGKVMIIEHPHSIFTIYAGFSEFKRAKGDEVKASETLGALASETPFYFEIRARNVAIDPVKWLQSL